MKREWMCALLCLAGAANARAEEPKRRTSFTNDDLDRIAPRRGETGVLSTPASKPDAAAPRPAKAADESGEAYWRREADKVRGAVQRLKAQAEAARARLDKARRAARDAEFRSARTAARGGSAAERGRADVRLAELEADLRGLEQQIRSREEELDERARRAGALPGWIR